MVEAEKKYRRIVRTRQRQKFISSTIDCTLVIATGRILGISKDIKK